MYGLLAFVLLGLAELLPERLQQRVSNWITRDWP